MRREGKNLVRQCRKTKRNVAFPPGNVEKETGKTSFAFCLFLLSPFLPGSGFDFEPVLCQFSFEVLPPLPPCSKKTSKAQLL